MNATFTLAARYRIRARCVTPLRTGGADANPESVLWDSQGRPMLQGSSIAGALRGWLTTCGETPEEVILGLFGFPPPSGENRRAEVSGQAGRLIVSDGKFPAGTLSVMRPRLKINGATGSAANGAKFDIAHIPPESEFIFTLTWLGGEGLQKELEAVEKTLSALHGGEIRLGAQKTNGFGQVRIDVSKRLYDMSQQADRDAWLEGREDGGTPLKLPGSDPGEYVVFRLKGRADSLLVKGASVELEKKGAEGEPPRSYTAHLRENGTPILPGSSVKGAVRAHAERIARYFNPEQSLTRELFGSEPTDGDEHTPGQVLFEDVTFRGSEPDRKITRIRINRFTAGVIRGGLFSEEPVSGTLELCVRVPANCGAGCALVLYALRDFGLGLCNFGSGGAIGRGYLSAQSLSAETPDGKRLALAFDGNGVRSVSDAGGIWTRWRQAWEEAFP
ncbi:MAG: hypothetical protein IKO14_00245 [Oscillibacter sp.]|nr:hypothetical protein [Oscillibacter sp.]